MDTKTYKSEVDSSSIKMNGEHCTINLAENQKLLQRESNPNSRLLIEFSELTYSVQQGSGNPKKILNKVYGCFRPDRLTALIGQSGAGKSTLLSIVSSLKSENVKGTIKVNGCERKASAFRKHTCFIPQEFALLPLLTVRETLYIACRLKLDRSCKERTPKVVIKEVGENLGLESSLDTLVDDLSGGERKRLSIGVEIITKPSILLLDEPTSGLDSANSNQVTSLLYKIARSGCTVVCAIHQPSCQMISQFDDVLLLDKGTSFYCGPFEDVLPTFASTGFTCPQFYNIAEFVLEVVTGQRLGDLEHLRRVSHEKYLRWRTETDCDRLEPNPLTTVLPERQSTDGCRPQPLSTWQQQGVLFHRAVICIKRDNTMTKLRFAAHVVVAFLLGIVFYDAGNNAARTNSNIASVFFILLFLYFSSSMPAVQMFPVEAAVFMREYLNNWYNLRSYVTVKILSDIPLQILCPTVFIIITYYLTGQPMECERFFQTWIICVLTTIVGQSSGILTGVAFNTHIGIFLIPALSMPLILFAGFFLKYSEMPMYLQPLSSISFFRYAFEGILQAVYGGNRERLPCQEVLCYFRSPKKILEMNDMPSVHYYTTVLTLGAWILVLNISIFSVLKWKSHVAKK